MIIYWWNLGQKQLDYAGDHKGFLKQKGIKVSPIAGGYRFKIGLSSTMVTLTTHGTYERCCDEAIKVFLILLGDKAEFNTSNRTFRLNW